MVIMVTLVTMVTMVTMGIEGHSIRHQDLNSTDKKGDLVLMDQIEKVEEI